MSVIVPPGVSGQPALYNSGNATLENVHNELALLTLGNFEPLRIHLNQWECLTQLEQFKDDWVDYLPRTDRPNNRKALTLTNLPGKTHRDVPSLAQACHEAGRRLSELEFNQRTDVFHKCPALSSWLEPWGDVGRTFLVNSNTGGFFVPHRDHPSLPRQCFRLVVFLQNCGPLQYDWWQDDRKMNIKEGQVYYVNTRMTHRTISWVDNSMHLIVNVPFTSENVARVIASLDHTH
jgi:hypothetical protein